MEPSALEPIGTSLALASATLLMVLAGLSKRRLIWRRRPPRRRHRR